MQSTQGRALMAVESLIAVAQCAMPSLLAARDRLLFDHASIADADADSVASSLEIATGQILLMLPLYTSKRVRDTTPDDLLLCDVAVSPAGAFERFVALLATALEPTPRNLREKMSSFFLGRPIALPLIGDTRVLARELIGGLTLGEVRRRDALRRS